MKTIQELTVEFNDDDRNIINNAYDLISAVAEELDEHNILNSRNLKTVYFGSSAELNLSVSDITNALYTFEILSNIYQLKSFEDESC